MKLYICQDVSPKWEDAGRDKGDKKHGVVVFNLFVLWVCLFFLQTGRDGGIQYLKKQYIIFIILQYLVNP